ncbi:MAG: hypothetical protein Q8N81_06000, partial [bacterium]|nr:hypothetical protein [bacterium]
MKTYSKILINILLTVILISGLLNIVSASSFNKQLNYQGKLTNTSNVAVADGSYHMFFRLYGSLSGSEIVWFEDRSQQ